MLMSIVLSRMAPTQPNVETSSRMMPMATIRAGGDMKWSSMNSLNTEKTSRIVQPTEMTRIAVS